MKRLKRQNYDAQLSCLFPKDPFYAVLDLFGHSPRLLSDPATMHQAVQLAADPGHFCLQERDHCFCRLAGFVFPYSCSLRNLVDQFVHFSLLVVRFRLTMILARLAVRSTESRAAQSQAERFGRA